jgi:hypothetical protein
MKDFFKLIKNCSQVRILKKKIVKRSDGARQNITARPQKPSANYGRLEKMRSVRREKTLNQGRNIWPLKGRMPAWGTKYSTGRVLDERKTGLEPAAFSLGS